MSFDAMALAAPQLRRLKAYDPGHDLVALRQRFGAVLAELGANENPAGPGPAARAALEAGLRAVHRYPDPTCGELRAALAQRLGVASEELAFGNGSHELLMQLAQAFAGPDRTVVHSRYGFAVYPLAAAVAGATAVCVQALPREHADAPLGHDLDALAAAIDQRTSLVYLANPNNPTGTWFGQEALTAFLERVPERVLVVVDEAYAEFHAHEGGQSALFLRPRFANLAVTRTFSKAQALAGLRVGYVVADAGVCAVLERLRENFSVGVLAQAAALASFEDGAWIEAGLAANARERARVAEGLAAAGWSSLPSRTNFLLVDCHGDATALERHLFEAGVVVRPVGGYGLGGWLRVSIGSAVENNRLLACLP